MLTRTKPPIDTCPGDPPDLGRVANDEIKRIYEARPDKPTAWVVSPPLNNVEAALEEMDRG